MRRYTSVPFAMSRICSACDRCRATGQPPGGDQRRRLTNSYDAVRGHLPLNGDDASLRLSLTPRDICRLILLSFADCPLPSDGDNTRPRNTDDVGDDGVPNRGYPARIPDYDDDDDG